MRKKILIIGSTCLDVIIRVDHLPETEENLHPEGQQFSVGGCAYNVANILGRCGADATFVTPVGLQGVFGPYILPILEKQPWVKPVLLPDEENGCCYCLVEKNGERTFLSIHGAEYTFFPAWMEAVSGERFDYTYVCGLEVEERTGDQLVAWLETADYTGTILYAPGPRGMKVPLDRTERLLALHPILHLNRSEALKLGASDDVKQAMQNLHQKTENSVVVTLGKDGAIILDGDGRFLSVPGYPAKQIADTIGAGDAHAGALLLGLSHGMSLNSAANLANQVSVHVVQQSGATLSDAALRPIQEALRQK
ncbi:MAG: carbohydrate kinase family protein [Clostridia bacterium]|nr:carbohydrate kinase family protein [Clostridia bacterium]